MKMQTEKTEKMKTARRSGGLLFIGSMFIGMAAGWYTHHMHTAMFAGMGIGFILMALVMVSQTNKK